MEPPPPGFSIVIPTRDRREHLSVCLAGLQALAEPPGGYEVIVVDDGGTQGLPASVQASLALRWVRLENNQGPAAARNYGASLARGRFLAFIDDDCVPDPQWLSRLYAVLAGDPRSAAGGRIVNGQPRNLYAEVNQTILDAVYRYYNADEEKAQFFATMNLAVPTELFRELGGFNPAYRTAEDRDFCARWIRGGLRLRYVPDATVSHQAGGGFRDFWRRHYRFGSGAHAFRRVHTKVASGKVTLEPLTFYRSLITATFRDGFTARALLASGLAAVSQLASAAGYLTGPRGRQTAKGRSS